MGKLGSQISRELRQNPKKAVILGAMCVVALYYWVPIIRRWSSPEDQPTTATASATPPVTPAAKGDSRLPWEKIAASIDGDPNMQPVDVKLGWNPFDRGRDLPVEEPAESPTTPEPVITSPEQAGLTLESTIVGSRRQTAVINGEAFSPGDWITAPTDTPLRYHLIAVTQNSVTLECQGHRFTLSLPDENNSQPIRPWSGNEQSRNGEPD